MSYPGEPSTPGFVVPFAGHDTGKPPTGGVDARREAEERKLLLQDFVANGIGEDQPIPAEILVQKLQGSPLEYSEDALRRTYSNLQSVSSEPVTGKRFLEAYLRREREIRAQIEKSTRELEALDRVLFQSQAHLKRVQGAEKPQIGAHRGLPIESDSKITVQVVSVQHFQREIEEGTAFKLHLECQSQVIETKTQVFHSGSVFWNEMFSFQIPSREGELQVTLVKVDFDSEEVVAECSVLIEHLDDQRKHEMAKEMWGTINCELQLSAQWIYSKRILYQGYVREFTAKRESKLREVEDLRIEFAALSKPFANQRSRQERRNLWGILEGPELLSRTIDRVMENMKLTNYQVASQYIVGISLILCCIASYARSLFFDLSIAGFAFWCNLDARRWSVNRYTVLLVAAAASLCLDAVWIVSYFDAWVNGTVESDMHNITKIFSLFNCLWKVIMMAFFWKCQYDLKKKLNLQRAVAAGRPVAQSPTRR